MKKKRLLFLLIAIGCAPIWAQKVINTAGTTAYGNNIILQYAVGEVVVEPMNGKDNRATQGVLQPRYIVAPNAIQDAFDQKYTLRCYPNPVRDALHVDTNFDGFKSVQVVNMQGQIVLCLPFDYTPINLSTLATGTYLLTLISNQKDISKTIKIIKQQ
jgi:hypothetical protein